MTRFLPVLAFSIPTLFLLCIGCASSVSKPDDKLFLPPSDRLVPILADVQLAEAALKSFKPAIRDSMVVVYYDRIAESHQCSREDILDWLTYIHADPQTMEDIYERVLESLNRQDAQDISD
jgi:hypothetical protein